MKNFILQLSILLSLTFAITSCKDPNNGDPMPSVATGTIKLKFDHMFEGESFVLDTTVFHYKNSYGDSLGFYKLRYYVSNIKFKKADGTVYAEPESYHIIDLDPDALNTDLFISGVPVGDYTTVEFILGVDSARNVSGAQSGALAPSNGMFWTWNSGYIFFMGEGKFENDNDVTTGKFIYHVGGFSGTNKSLQTISLTIPHSGYARVSNGAQSSVHLHVDLEHLFNDPEQISINDLKTIHMPGANALKLSNNYKNMFSLDHVHN